MQIPKASKAESDADVELYNRGVEEGRQKQKTEILTYLEGMYLNPAIERGSVEGEAILSLAKFLSEEFKK